jgi:anti-anti-sigma factor
MEITTVQVQGRVPVTVMRLSGTFDASTADAFDAEAKKQIENGAKDILIDLSGVAYMSSAGMRSLHKVYTALHASDAESDRKSVYEGISAGTYASSHLKLLKVTPRVMEVLKVTGIDMYVSVLNDEAQAIASF